MCSCIPVNRIFMLQIEESRNSKTGVFRFDPIQSPLEPDLPGERRSHILTRDRRDRQQPLPANSLRSGLICIRSIPPSVLP
jgi:hypothetical protein